jgi:hypothetical protein
MSQLEEIKEVEAKFRTLSDRCRSCWVLLETIEDLEKDDINISRLSDAMESYLQGETLTDVRDSVVSKLRTKLDKWYKSIQEIRRDL